MKKFLLLPLAALSIALASCQKDKDEYTPDLPIDVCGIDGMRLKADVDGAAICFSTSLFGTQAGGQFTIGGLNTSAYSLALQLDEVTVGTHAVTEETNHMLLTVSGVAYQSSNDAPGSVTITSHDTGGNHLKGSFSVQMVPPGTGEAKNVSGTFDITYIEG